MKRLLFTFLSVLCAYTVFAQCNASFTWAPAPQGNNLLRVGFTNTTVFTPPNPQSYANYDISYGDNSSSYMYVSGTTYHNYAAPGTYAVVVYMYAYDSLTQQYYCGDTVSQNITIGYPACGTTITSVANSANSYTFSANTPAGTSGMSYSWNFGDGNTGTGTPVSHVYTTPGVYTVTVVATGPSCSYTNTTVAQAGGSVNCNNLNASFYAATNNMTGTFSNTSSSGGPMVARVAHWNFGDGSPIVNNMNYTSHVYGATGTYTVTLINEWKDSVTQTILCTDTAIQNITISGTNPGPNMIDGYIIWDSLNMSQVSFKVWLITHDSAANTLTAVDSAVVVGFSSAYYSFLNKPANVYYTKAAMISAQPAGIGYVPTYHSASIYWATATPINHAGGSSVNKHIWMQMGTVSSGPGFIGGNISLGANKGTATGAPNVLVFLRDNASQLVRSTYTDANGDYSFGNIATGNYTIYPEEMNYITIPSGSLTVTNSQTTVTGIDFKKTPTHIKPVTTAINNVTRNAFQMFPNPSNGKVELAWRTGLASKATINIANITGSNVFSSEVSTDKNVNLDLSNLQTGVYFIRINAGNEQHIEKLILQR